jgi:Fe-Mn family superoxide dismutase
MFKRIALPYNLDYLEPIISKETMNVHYNFHHKVYEDNLNDIVSRFGLNNKYSVEYLLKNLDSFPKDLGDGIRDFGGGLFNHDLFFSILTKKDNFGETFISKELFSKIYEDFGSFYNFKKNLLEISLSLFGSGWSWLVLDKNNNLKIIKTSNQDSPISLELDPIIGIDVWEHAYYLDYNSNRRKYLELLIDHLLNWKLISEKYSSLIELRK